MSKDFLKKPPRVVDRGGFQFVNCRPGGMSDDDDSLSDYSDNSFDDYHGQYSAAVAPVVVAPISSPQFQLQPLRYAILRGSQEDVEACVKSLEGFNINDPIDGHWNALFYACNIGRPEILSFLIEKGADPKHTTRNGLTALMVMACADNKNHTSHNFDVQELLKGAQILIQHGVDVNAKEEALSATALHFAIKSDNVQLVKFLLEKGADVHSLDSDRKSPLDWAAARGLGPIIKILLRYSPDLNVINCFGYNASESAAFNRFPKIAKFLYLYNRIHPGKTENVDASCLESNEVADFGDYSSQYERAFVERDYVDGILAHLKLRKHLAIFKKQDIKLVDFLQLSDADLIKMGISELGDRINIIDGIRKIHNFDWKRTSVMELTTNNMITIEDSVNLIKNIEFHLSLMSATIKYLTERTSLEGDSTLLQPVMHGKKENATRMIKYCQQLQKHLETLNHTHDLFKKYIQKIQQNAEFRLGDYIGPK